MVFIVGTRTKLIGVFYHNQKINLQLNRQMNLCQIYYQFLGSVSPTTNCRYEKTLEPFSEPQLCTTRNWTLEISGMSDTEKKMHN